MERFTVSRAGSFLLELLRDALEEEFDIERERIGMGVPGEDKQLALCVCLYDIRKNTDMYLPQMVPVSNTELRYPSNYYDLYYMLVPYSYSELKYRMEEEIRTIDVLLQLLGDVHRLGGEEPGSGTGLELYDMNMEEKTRVWSGFNQSLRTALYCKVGPIEIQSAKRKIVKRVLDVQANVMEKDGRKG